MGHGQPTNVLVPPKGKAVNKVHVLEFFEQAPFVTVMLLLPEKVMCHGRLGRRALFPWPCAGGSMLWGKWVV